MIVLAAALLGATPSAEAAEHAVNLRYRRGFVPSSLIDIWYFDSDDEGALPYDRPKLSANVFGLEYMLRPNPPAGSAFYFWFDRYAVSFPSGYWDDKEDPPEHNDGDWIEASGVGIWDLGATFAQEFTLTDEAQPVWLGLEAGLGLGIGFVTGTLTTWHAGAAFHEGVVDETCLPMGLSPDRAKTCDPDGEIDLPGVLPVLELRVSPVVHITEHAHVRLDLGLHQVPFVGVAAGGVLPL